MASKYRGFGLKLYQIFAAMDSEQRTVTAQLFKLFERQQLVLRMYRECKEFIMDNEQQLAKLFTEIDNELLEVRDYFEGRADADDGQPNEEMRMDGRVSSVLETLARIRHLLAIPPVAPPV